MTSADLPHLSDGIVSLSTVHFIVNPVAMAMPISGNTRTEFDFLDEIDTSGAGGVLLTQGVFTSVDFVTATGELITAEDQIPFALEVGYIGYFRLDRAPANDSERERVHAAASAVVFPYARHMIQTLTAECDGPTMRVPLYNFREQRAAWRERGAPEDS